MLSPLGPGTVREQTRGDRIHVVKSQPGRNWEVNLCQTSFCHKKWNLNILMKCLKYLQYVNKEQRRWSMSPIGEDIDYLCCLPAAMRIFFTLHIVSNILSPYCSLSTMSIGQNTKQRMDGWSDTETDRILKLNFRELLNKREDSLWCLLRYHKVWFHMKNSVLHFSKRFLRMFA